MIKKIKDKYLLIIVQIIIFFVSLINVFPNQYSFSGGDIYQYINLPKLVERLSYTWISLTDAGFQQHFPYVLFYFPFSVLTNTFNISPSSQSFLYYFLFLTASFWGFYSSTKYFHLGVSTKYAIFFSFIYSFNIYVYNAFFLIWGFSPFLYLYPLIPLIFGITYELIVVKKSVDLGTMAKFGIIAFLTNVSFGNIPFFISLNIFLSFFILILFLFRRGIQTPYYLIKIIALYLIFYLSVFWSVVPQILEMFKLAKSFTNNESFFNIGNWIIWQSVRFPNVFFLSNEIQTFIANNSILGYFSLSIFIAFLLSFTIKKNGRDMLTLTFLFLLILNILLLNKGIGFLSEKVILSIFQKNVILASLRSVDKTLIFLPFFTLIIILLNFNYLDKLKRYVCLAILLTSLISVFPFFTGGIQINYSGSFTKGSNIKNSKYTFIHIIPDEYVRVSNLLNRDREDGKILRIPYSVVNSLGWVNFPKWKQVGVDPTLQFFKSSTIQMNSPNTFGKWSYGEHWNNSSISDSQWLIPFAGLLNVKYIIYHKDIEHSFLAQTQYKIQYFEKNNLLTKIDSNKYFDTYKINPDKFLPHIYSPIAIVTSTSLVNKLPDILLSSNYHFGSAIYFHSQNIFSNKINQFISQFNKGTNSMINIEYRKIDPTKYKVIIRNAKGIVPLILSEYFNDGWKVYISNINEEHINNRPRQKIIKSAIGTKQNDNLSSGNFYDNWFNSPIDENRNHYVANGYSNSWFLDTNALCEGSKKCILNSDGSYDYSIYIEFLPQHLYYLGALISGGMVFASILIYAYLIIFNRFRSR